MSLPPIHPSQVAENRENRGRKLTLQGASLDEETESFMTAERVPKVLWRRRVGTIHRSRRPRLMIRDIDDDGDLEVLVGLQKLHVLNELGSCEWAFGVRGDLEAIAVGHAHSGSRLITVGTSRVFDVIVSSAGAISVLQCEGLVYFLTPQGVLLLETSLLGGMITIATLLDCDSDGQDELCAGIKGIGPRTSGKVVLISQEGAVNWRHAIESPVSALLAHGFGNGKPRIFAGTERGELLALSSAGRLIWQRQVGNDQVMCIRVASSSKHEDCLVVGVRDGTSAVFSLAGSLRWKHVGSLPVVDLCCVDVNGDAEDEVIVGYLDAIHCMGLHGAPMWKVPVGGRLTSLDLLSMQHQSDAQLLACADSTGLILSAATGLVVCDLQLGGYGLVCRALRSRKTPGWVVCVARPAKNLLWRLLGYQDIELVLAAIPQQDSEAVNSSVPTVL